MKKVDGYEKIDVTHYKRWWYGLPFFIVYPNEFTDMGFGLCLHGIMLRNETIRQGDRFLLSDAKGHRHRVVCQNVARDTEQYITVFAEPQVCEAGEDVSITVTLVKNWDFTATPLLLYRKQTFWVTHQVHSD